MNKIIAILILIIVFLIAGIVYFVSSTGLVQKQVKPPSELVTEEITQVQPTTNLQQKPPPEINFSKTGEIVKKETGFILLYGEPGNPAATVQLIFTPNSLCDLGEGKKLCETAKFEDGIRVKIDGNRKNNEVEVVEIEKEN